MDIDRNKAIVGAIISASGESPLFTKNEVSLPWADEWVRIDQPIEDLLNSSSEFFHRAAVALSVWGEVVDLRHSTSGDLPLSPERISFLVFSDVIYAATKQPNPGVTMREFNYFKENYPCYA